MSKLCVYTVHSCTYALNSDYQWHHKVCTGHLPISILYPHGGQLGCATEPELPGWEDQKNCIATSNVCLYTAVVRQRTSKAKYAASYPNPPRGSWLSSTLFQPSTNVTSHRFSDENIWVQLLTFQCHQLHSRHLDDSHNAGCCSLWQQRVLERPQRQTVSPGNQYYSM